MLRSSPEAKLWLQVYGICWSVMLTLLPGMQPPVYLAHLQLLRVNEWDTWSQQKKFPLDFMN